MLFCSLTVQTPFSPHPRGLSHTLWVHTPHPAGRRVLVPGPYRCGAVSVPLAPLWEGLLRLTAPGVQTPLCVCVCVGLAHGLWSGRGTERPVPRCPLQATLDCAELQKCPLGLPWVTSFQMENHHVFTFTYADAVPYLDNFHAILCGFVDLLHRTELQNRAAQAFSAGPSRGQRTAVFCSPPWHLLGLMAFFDL